jgi:hypothetical protein
MPTGVGWIRYPVAMLPQKNTDGHLPALTCPSSCSGMTPRMMMSVAVRADHRLGIE